MTSLLGTWVWSAVDHHPVLFSLFLLFVSLLFFHYLTTTRNNMPPGPTPLPLIGNLHLLIGKRIEDVYSQMAKEYGDIFTFNLGMIRVVVLNSSEVSKEALGNLGDMTSGRPSFNHLMEGVYPLNSGITLSEGDLWKSNRKFCFRHLGEFGFGKKSFEDNIQTEVDMFVAAIRERRGEAFDINHTIGNAVSNIVCCLVFGKRYEYDDEEFAQIMHWFDIITQIPQAVVIAPFLKKLPMVRSNLEKIREGFRVLDTILTRHLEEHKLRYDSNSPVGLIDAYLQGKFGDVSTDKLSDLTIFEDLQIRSTLLDLLGAGTETTTTTLRWALLYLMTFPEVQDKMRAEIHSVVGTERNPEVSDRRRLPYTEAVILEVQRLGNVSFMSVPHKTTEDVKFHGYDIPANTTIVPNLTGIHMKEDDFPNPRMFRPERFLNSQGDIDKTLAEKTIPFGIGKRKCLGEPLARMELFLFFAAMIQKFTFKLPEGAPKPSLLGSGKLVNDPMPFDVHANAI